MRIAYLTWVKNLIKDLENREDRDECCNLAGSAISEPSHLLDALAERGMWKTVLSKPDPWWNASLLEAIAARYGVDSGNILVTNGASEAIFLVCLTFLEPGDHVIVEMPVYEPIRAVPEFLRAKVTFLRRKPEADFDIDLEAFSTMVSKNTKLVLMTNLHNPSGFSVKETTLRQMIEVGRKVNPDLKWAVDEVYHDFIREKQMPAALMDDGMITLNSLSKVFGLGLLRCGWILASSEHIENLRKGFVLMANWGSPMHQSVSLEIFKSGVDFEAHWRTHLAGNRLILQDSLYRLFEEGLLTGRVPEDGCICFPGIADIQDTRAFAEKLAEEKKVFVVPGAFFGNKAHIRIGYGGRSEELAEGLSRLSDFVRDYRSR